MPKYVVMKDGTKVKYEEYIKQRAPLFAPDIDDLVISDEPQDLVPDIIKKLRRERKQREK